jgi:hypothetical protein
MIIWKVIFLQILSVNPGTKICYDPVYGLLMTDYETLAACAGGQDPPAPLLYDPEVHKRHRNGHYQTHKPKKQKQLLLEQPHPL